MALKTPYPSDPVPRFSPSLGEVQDTGNGIASDNKRRKRFIVRTIFSLALMMGALASPALASTMDCSQSGSDVVCTYAADIGGPTYELWQHGVDPRCDSSSSNEGTMTCSGVCSSEATGLVFDLSVDGPHPDNDTATGFITAQVVDFACVVSGGPIFTPNAANSALVTVVDGAQGLLWDSLGNALLVVASIGIIVALFWVVYRALVRFRIIHREGGGGWHFRRRWE